jgi:hypothetical protein
MEPVGGNQERLLENISRLDGILAQDEPRGRLKDDLAVLR